MELLQLKYFTVLVEKKHLQQAAEALYISPPSLSASISRLERDLDVKLFDRTSRGLQLNQLGTIYYQRIKQVLILLEQANREIADISNKTLSVSIAVTSPNVWHGLIGDFVVRHPEITLSQNYVNISSINKDDLVSRYDFLFSAANDFTDNGLKSLSLYTGDQAAVLMYPSHPLAQCSQIDLRDLAQERFVALSSDHSARKFFDEVFARAGIKPIIIAECDYWMRKRFIEDEKGISISSVRAGQYDPSSRLKYIPIEFPRVYRAQSIFWHPQRKLSDAAVVFKEFAEKYFYNENSRLSK